MRTRDAEAQLVDHSHSGLFQEMKLKSQRMNWVRESGEM